MFTFFLTVALASAAVISSILSAHKLALYFGADPDLGSFLGIIVGVAGVVIWLD